MTHPFLYNILFVVMASTIAIGLHWVTMQETRINAQEERIKMLEDALLIKTKEQGAGRPSRSLQDNCECPFAKNEDGDWVTTDADSLFIFNKGVIIGKKNTGWYNYWGNYVPACNYGNSVLSVDAEGKNCPSGDGSVTFGSMNEASGEQSAVVGGQGNEASGPFSSISGGFSNTATAYYVSISGGAWNLASEDYSSISGGLHNIASAIAGSISGGMWNTVQGNYGSILGGVYHVLAATSGTVSSKSNFKNVTNATVIETIPAHHPEDRIAALEEHSPFDCTTEEGWCTSEHKRFLFSEGVVVGKKNPECKYGTGTLSVDFMGTNCPAHRGSVTFGKKNQMSKAGSFTVG